MREVGLLNAARANAVMPGVPIQPVTNIGQFFEQMSYGWTLGPAARRMLIATRETQFISVDISKRWTCFYEPHVGDIPVVSAGYSMVGFVKFEAQREFKGLFEVSNSGDDHWWGAVLTERGYNMAMAGLVEDFKFLDHPFFNPAFQEVELPKALSTTSRIQRLAGDLA